MNSTLVKSSLSLSVFLAMGVTYAGNSKIYAEATAGIVIGASTNAKSQGKNQANHPSDGWDVDSKDAFGGLVVGYTVTPVIVIEGDLRYRENATDSGQYKLSPNPTGNAAFVGTVVNQDAMIKTSSFMVNGKYFFDIPTSKIRPYAKVGIGVVQNKTNSILDMTPGFTNIGGAATLDSLGNGCKGSIKWCYPEGKQTNFAWSVGLGAQYPLNDQIYVGLDYQFINLGKAKTDIDPNGDRLEVKSMRDHEIGLKLGYRF